MKNWLVLMVGSSLWSVCAWADSPQTPPAKAPSSPAPANEEQVVEGVDCQNGAVKRRLEAQTKGAGCVLMYTKAGKTEEIARSRRGVDLCLENLKKVRKNLEAGGYSCQ